MCKVIISLGQNTQKFTPSQMRNDIDSLVIYLEAAEALPEKIESEIKKYF